MSSRERVRAVLAAERARIEGLFRGDARAVESQAGPGQRLVAALEGLDLSPEEWRTVEGLVGPMSEAQTTDRIASIIEKARAAGDR